MTSFLCEIQNKSKDLIQKRMWYNRKPEPEEGSQEPVALTHLQHFAWNLGQQLLQLGRSRCEEPVQGRCSVQHELSHQWVYTREIK